MEPSCQRKMLLGPCCKTDQHTICNVINLRHESCSFSSEMSKKLSWEELRRQLDSCKECFEGLLNPVRTTCDTIVFVKVILEVFSLTEVAAAKQRLKSRKAAGGDES